MNNDLPAYWILAGQPPLADDPQNPILGTAFPNQTDVYKSLGREGVSPFMSTQRWADAPALKIDLHDRNLVVDVYLLPLGPVVSAAFRDALGMHMSNYELHPVDCTGCCVEAELMDYRLLHILVEAPLVDASASDYDANTSLDWLPRGFPTYIRRLELQPELATDFLLARDQLVKNHIFCRDDAAKRIVQAGCTGVMFTDPATQQVSQPVRYRTADGSAIMA